MAHSDSYWRKRQAAMMAGLDRRDAKFTTQLQKEYSAIMNDLQKEIAYYYQSYGVDDVLKYRTMMASLSDAERDAAFKDFDAFVKKYPQYKNLVGVRNNIYKLNRAEGLELSIKMKMAELGAIEQSKMDEYLKSSYEYGYMSTMKNLGNINSFYRVDDQLLRQTLDKKWFDEKNYSNRIWDNKDTLRNWLTSDFRNGLIAGVNYDKMLKSLQRRINVGKFYAKRLIWTESSYMMNQANAHAFMAEGITLYRYSAILDERTSNTCRGLNDEVFELKDYSPGKNAPPMHSFCRSTIIPIENDDVNIVVNDSKKFWDDIEKQQQDDMRERFRKAVKDGIIKVEMNLQKQNTHIQGTYEYNQRLETNKSKNIPPQSYLLIDIKEVDELISRYSGTGRFKYRADGKPSLKEIITHDTLVGTYVDPVSAEIIETNQFRIHYSKNGAHIVPTVEGKYNR